MPLNSQGSATARAVLLTTAICACESGASISKEALDDLSALCAAKVYPWVEEATLPAWDSASSPFTGLVVLVTTDRVLLNEVPVGKLADAPWDALTTKVSDALSHAETVNKLANNGPVDVRMVGLAADAAVPAPAVGNALEALHKAGASVSVLFSGTEPANVPRPASVQMREDMNALPYADRFVKASQVAYEAARECPAVLDGVTFATNYAKHPRQCVEGVRAMSEAVKACPKKLPIDDLKTAFHVLVIPTQFTSTRAVVLEPNGDTVAFPKDASWKAVASNESLYSGKPVWPALQ